MRYLGIISYNGTDFFGFQRQPKLRNVQSILEAALSELLDKKTLIKGAGRTDKGVHALAQCISFDAAAIQNKDKFLFAINRILPPDVVFISLEEKDAGFDARHSSKGKVYRYDFTWGRRDPLLLDRAAQLERSSFSIDLFLQALECFKGRHDFSNFTTKSNDVDGFIRNIRTIDTGVDLKGKSASVTLCSDGFMTYMVRLIIGACFKVAIGKIKLEDLPKLIDAKPRHIVSYKAPACGLYLVKVLYE